MRMLVGVIREMGMADPRVPAERARCPGLRRPAGRVGVVVAGRTTYKEEGAYAGAHPALALSPATIAWGITMAIRNYLVGASIRLAQPEPGDSFDKARQSRCRSRRGGYRR